MTTAVITAERAANGLENAGVGRGYRAHPTWPWLHFYPDGDIWDARLGRYRKQTDRGDGYRVINVEGKTRLVHRLLMEAWHGLNVWRDHGEVSRHKDGSTRNHVLNLQPGSQRANMGDLMRHRGNESSEHCPRSHVKTGANLVKWSVKQGWSACRACMNANGKASHWRRTGRTVPEEQVKLWADEKYTKLTADTLGTLAFAVTATATAPHLMATA